MKNLRNIITATIPVVLLMCVATGCDTIHSGCSGTEEGKTWVRMTGALPARGTQTVSSRATVIPGPIDPDQFGLPPRQLDVAIITVNHLTSDPILDRPGYGEWAGQTADITRGFFGSRSENPYNNGILPDNVEPTNGQIEYVDETGYYVQRVFYPEALNEYFYLKVVYPYQGLDMFIQMPDGSGAAALFSGLTGQEDILCSNLGWGTQTQPIVETDVKISNPALDPGSPYYVDPGTIPGYDAADYPDSISVLTFSHMLSQLRFRVVAENATAKQQYGDILDIVVRFQPDKVALRMIDGEIMRAQDAVDTDFRSDFFLEGAKIDSIDIALYDPAYDPVAHGNTPQGIYAGCLMVMPDYTFRVEAETSLRKWIGADYDFKLNGVAETILPGHIYDVTLKFMEAYKLEIKMSDAGEWWMDSVFD